MSKTSKFRVNCARGIPQPRDECSQIAKILVLGTRTLPCTDQGEIWHVEAAYMKLSNCSFLKIMCVNCFHFWYILSNMKLLL